MSFDETLQQVHHQLNQIESVKQDLKAAIEGRGVDLFNVPFTEYSEKLRTNPSQEIWLGSSSAVTEIHSDVRSVCDYGLAERDINIISLPLAESLGYGCFYSSRYVNNVYIPLVKAIPEYCFSGCMFDKIELPSVTLFKEYALANTYFKEVFLGADQVIVVSNRNAFYGSSILKGNAKIFVPDHLLEAYRTATNWVEFSDSIYPISEKDVV
ncbi:leucine-rich repeat protein [Enterococcus sp. DIV0800]|uniref:leucine-rich repeat protein n=1 Tax=unclassified Enterococcus TaxID=2608891 RepID=UPI003D2FBEEA